MTKNETLKKNLLSCCRQLNNSGDDNLSIFMKKMLKLTDHQIKILQNFDINLTSNDFLMITFRIKQYCESEGMLIDNVLGVLYSMEYEDSLTYVDTMVLQFIEKSGSTDINDVVLQLKLDTNLIKKSLKKLIELKHIKYSEHLQCYFIKE